MIIGSIPLQSVYQQYRPPPGPITPHDVNINFVGEATPIPSAPDMRKLTSYIGLGLWCLMPLSAIFQ